MNFSYFHDFLCILPEEPDPGDEITLFLRVQKNCADEASLCLSEGKERCKLPEGVAPWKIPMEKTASAAQAGPFDHYTASFRVGSVPVTYYFEITWGDSACLLDAAGITDGSSESEGARHPFRILPGFHVPQWAKGAVMYQIFTDRFCNGDTSNDVQTGEYTYLNRPVRQVENWDRYPESFDVCNFYGGDLEGVRRKLDYLKELGVEAIYFNPIFVSPSNHKYDTQDYDHIDPHFTSLLSATGKAGRACERTAGGFKEAAESRDASESGSGLQPAAFASRWTDEHFLEESDLWFADFVREVHAHGMKVILDGVFNHCGSFHKWMDRERIYEGTNGHVPGAFGHTDSPYRNYFRFKDLTSDAYESWWDVETLPKLNYEECDELCEDVFRIAQKWLSEPYCIDGWRLDVAADLGHSEEFNHRFWKEFRRRVKEVNPQALILAEHYGSPSAWLSGCEWDTVMNYDAFMEPVSWFFTGMDKHSDSFDEEKLGNANAFCEMMAVNGSAFPGGSLLSAMNELSNHDHSRFLTRTNRKAGRVADLGPESASEGVDRGVLMEAVVMQMTWPGAPTIYYGDEAGLCGWTDPDNRRTYPWGQEDQELIAFHAELTRIRRENPVLRDGSVQMLLAEEGVLAYARFRPAVSSEDANRQRMASASAPAMDVSGRSVMNAPKNNRKVVVLFNHREEKADITVPLWPAEIPDGTELTQVFCSTRGTYFKDPYTYRVQDGCIHASLDPRTAVILVC